MTCVPVWESRGPFMAWGWGQYCCWTFVPLDESRTGWEVMRVGGCLCLPLETKFLPHACPSAGALLKAAFICAGIVHVHSELQLNEQLLRTFGGGFELHTWSELPHGSGLGKRALPPATH